MKRIIGLLICLNLFACNMDTNKNEYFDIQGHRGCRGLYPENTIPAFVKAIELGVSTLELDLGVSKDLQVVVSHEPFFSRFISTAPDGSEINNENELLHNLFQLTYDEIKTYDVGLKPHPFYLNQHKIRSYKPTLNEVFEVIEEKVKENGFKIPYYNLEIKRRPEWDGEFHPDVQEFVKIVLQLIDESGLVKRINIQSFDIETLQIVHKINPKIKLALLIENMDTPENNIQKLGFIPDIYSPHHRLVDDHLLKYCEDNDMLLIPWTVNSKNIMKELIKLGVNGIISDYPDSLIQVAKEMNLHIL